MSDIFLNTHTHHLQPLPPSSVEKGANIGFLSNKENNNCIFYFFTATSFRFCPDCSDRFQPVPVWFVLPIRSIDKPAICHSERSAAESKNLGVENEILRQAQDDMGEALPMTNRLICHSERSAAESKNLIRNDFGRRFLEVSLGENNANK